ncbi:MAG: sigma-70 family RNA polymerase sigma factor [Phycisphaerales bacterium]|nr:sigma-70 family RNA polymerase sigma factor [Phycisphaerales bacterium]
MTADGIDGFLSGNHGDRDAIARMLLRNEAQIRRRIAGKLSANVRSVFDSQEIMSTVLRRMDKYVLEGGYSVHTEAQFWSLVQRLISNAIIDKARVVNRLRTTENEDRLIAQALLGHMDAAASDDEDLRRLLRRVIQILPDDLNQEILWMWLKGNSHTAIARSLGLTPDAARKRWQRIRDDLSRDFLTDEA